MFQVIRKTKSLITGKETETVMMELNSIIVAEKLKDEYYNRIDYQKKLFCSHINVEFEIRLKERNEYK